MPQKDEIQLGPERLGLSERDVMYLLIFRELHGTIASPADIYDVIREDLLAYDRGRARSYFYTAINRMESFGWIELTRNEKKNNKKYYAITETGKAKINDFKVSCMDSISSLKRIADHFAYHITGTGKADTLELNKDQRMMFSRLINVRHLIRFLFLKTLIEKQPNGETGKNIWKLLKERYQWQCAQGYFYELAHEMENEQNYIRGTWISPQRRSAYVYQLTEAGYTALNTEAEAALYYIRELQKYSRFILNLFPEHRLTNSQNRD